MKKFFSHIVSLIQAAVDLLAKVCKLVYENVIPSNLVHNILASLVLVALLYPVAGVAAIGFVGLLFFVHLMPINLYARASLRAGLLKEVWLSRFMNNFYREGDFIGRSVDMSLFVENNTINLAEAGVDPNVLVNNASYPVATNDFTANPLALPLDYLDTENTRVRNALKRQYAFSAIDAMSYQHRNALMQKTKDLAAWNWTPNGDSNYTPVIPTTGGDNGSSFKRLKLEDIAKLQRIFDSKAFPQQGRILVLHPNHVEDLIVQDISLFKKFAELGPGQVLPLYGFEVYKYALTATFNKSTGAKVSFGAAAAPSTDTVSSFAYCEGEVMRAQGTLDMFFKPAEINTDGRADEIGFQMRFKALPIRSKAIAAIYSAVYP